MSFVNAYNCVCVFLSRLVLKVGFRILLYKFLIFADFFLLYSR